MINVMAASAFDGAPRGRASDDAARHTDAQSRPPAFCKEERCTCLEAESRSARPKGRALRDALRPRADELRTAKRYHP